MSLLLVSQRGIEVIVYYLADSIGNVTAHERLLDHIVGTRCRDGDGSIVVLFVRNLLIILTRPPTLLIRIDIDFLFSSIT